MQNTRKPKKKDKTDYVFFDGWGLVSGENRLNLSGQALALLRWMDGKTSNEKLRQLFKKKYNIKLSLDEFEKFKHRINELDLLVNEVDSCLKSKLNIYFKREQDKKFEKKNIREPSYAGVCYSNNPHELASDLRLCFSSVDNRKLSVILEKMHGLRGIIVPHSNIELSGCCAAWAYKALSKIPMPDLFIILAPDHSGFVTHPFSALYKNLRTPLGLVKTDKVFLGMLVREKPGFDIFANSFAHLVEHAIELQLPFLQYIYKKNLEKLRIVSILCKKEPHEIELNSQYIAQREHFFQAFKKTILKSGKRVVFIGTGDLLHINKWKTTVLFHNFNKKIIRLLKKTNAEYLRTIMDSDNYMSCGRQSFYPFLKLLEPTRAEVLNYSWTSDPSFFKKNETFKYESLINIGHVSMVFS